MATTIGKFTFFCGPRGEQRVQLDGMDGEYAIIGLEDLYAAITSGEFLGELLKRKAPRAPDAERKGET